MILNLVVHKPLYTRESTGAYYIDCICNDNPVVERHEQNAKRVDNKPHYPSLVDGILTIKIPWRYGRPMVKANGIVTVYDIEPADAIWFEAAFTDWETEWGCGTSWKMTKIC
jgi:hypothetical protein